jgi:hypothetical protein
MKPLNMEMFMMMWKILHKESSIGILHQLMGPIVDRILKIPCKFQMGQSQGQEWRRSRKQCKDWCNPLGPSLQIYWALINMGLKEEEPTLIHVI